jgi:predicted nucleotidyltransferase
MPRTLVVVDDAGHAGDHPAITRELTSDRPLLVSSLTVAADAKCPPQALDIVRSMALFEPVFAALNAAGVRYVVVGGVAVVLHGHARLTADLDLSVDLAPYAAARAIDALTAIGLQPRVPVDPRGFADPAVREGWIKDRGMVVFTLLDPNDPIRSVDLFVENPIDFEELWSKALVLDLQGTGVRVSSIPHLIQMKRQAARPFDSEDIEALEEIMRNHSE